MGALPDWKIEKEVSIIPFSPCEKRPGKISYGVSSYGYDCRVGYRFKIFTPVFCTEVDPKAFDPKSFVERELEPGKEPGYVLIPPNSFALAESVEWFKIPRDMLVLGIGKSTYARCGIILNVTPLEPEWEGRITLEISNTAPLPAKIYAGEGICQLVFVRAEDVCQTSYADKKGKYQSQTGLTLPTVDQPKE